MRSAATRSIIALKKTNLPDPAGPNSCIGKAACAFLPLVFKKMSWQRHVLASRGYLELGMLDDAEQALEQIGGEDKTQREVLHAALVISLAAENWDRAVAIAADLVKAEPKNPTTWILLAYAVGHAGNVEQMETVLFKARKWHPRDPLVLFRLACCASVTGRIEEAKLRLGTAIDLDESVRRLALDDEDLRPLWDWLTQTP